jgi:hypothetical protein
MMADAGYGRDDRYEFELPAADTSAAWLTIRHDRAPTAPTRAAGSPSHVYADSA